MAIKKKHYTRKSSVQSCLLFLGADWADVYYTREERNKKSNRAGNRSKLYDTLSNAEILDWAKHLYKKKLVENHPDKFKNKKKQEEVCRELGEAYETIKGKLRSRSICFGKE